MCNKLGIRALLGLTLLVLLSSLVHAQNPLPAGSTLPIELTSTIDSNDAKPGDKVTAKTTQRIPLDASSSIPERAKITGHVTEVAQSPAPTLAIQFDSIKFRDQEYPLHVKALAIASYLEAAEAKTPQSGPIRGESDSNWTTIQIGGDISYHSGPVVNDGKNVGYGDTSGAWIDDPDRSVPLAYGPFSVDARGVYGLDEMQMIESPNGASLKVTAPGERVKLPRGTVMLLKMTE